MILGTNKQKEIIEIIKSGGIVILPTDTVYGIHCLYMREDLKKIISHLKERDENMPFITLIDSREKLLELGVITNLFQETIINKMWPGTNTLVFDTDKDIFSKDQTVSVRLPNNPFLISIMKETGPLLSTSANIHSLPPAKTIDEAVTYFGDSIQHYVDGGTLDNKPSFIYRLYEAHLEQIR